ncbi:NAD(P)H-dependent oxidoreductase subunit E [Ornithinimicrobium sp. W1679]|uniref:NAD(P)H-dependent oxidoreductase subunit E n=1 Tax=unclassified Ornithinimicrobium TaxID=2615080 RepID=UPI003CFB5CAF
MDEADGRRRRRRDVPRDGVPARVPEGARADAARDLARRRAGERGPLLEVLHDVQDALGWIDEADVRVLADELNLSVAEVHGVVSFYHDFRRTSPPAHTVRVCRAEACQSVGAEQVYAAAQQAVQAVGPDVELHQVFCFGNCALGPTVEADGVLHGRVDESGVQQLVAELADQPPSMGVTVPTADQEVRP